jgi:hypothetical protein
MNTPKAERRVNKLNKGLRAIQSIRRSGRPARIKVSKAEVDLFLRQAEEAKRV